MPRKKFTIEYIKNEFLKKGYILLENEYINNRIKMKYKCPNGHVNSISWDSFRRGHGCPDCSGKKKLTIEFVRKEFSKRGWKLLSTEYVNSKQKLQYKCSNSHINEITWNSFQQGISCPDCSGKKKLTIEEIEIAFSKRNFKLLSNVYINSMQKLLYECPNKHINEIAWHDFKKGHGCPDCAKEERANKLRLDIQFIREQFSKRGYILLSSEYSHSKQKLRYKCDSGHVNEISWDYFNQGKGCPICGKKRGLQKLRETLYKNGNAPCSKQQKYLHNLLGGELNYPVKTLSLDIAFIDNDEKIYLEYDGSGHNMVVNRNGMTKKEFERKELTRFYTLKKEGWKEIRIISKRDRLPSDEKILELVKYAKDYLNTGHSWIHIDIDNSEIKCSQFTKKVDLGELRKIY